MPNRLEGKVIIVTGAGGGIGRAVAQRLAADGALVSLVDVNSESVRDAAHAIGDRAYAIVSNLAEPSSVDEYMASTIGRFGKIDGVCNNAAILTPPTPFIDQSDEYYDTQWRVNERAVYVGTRQALKYFIARGKGGAIVNMSSLSGIRASRNLAAYSASKFAVVGLSRVAAAEGGPFGVRVNVVCPGFILTPAADHYFKTSDPAALEKIEAGIPVGRAGRPEEVGSLVAWLLSGEASYVSGAVIPIDGALSAAI